MQPTNITKQINHFSFFFQSSLFLLFVPMSFVSFLKVSAIAATNVIVFFFFFFFQKVKQRWENIQEKTVAYLTY